MSTPHCTLCWPSTVKATQVQGGKYRFVVGWNPKGFIVVVADVVHAATVEEAEKIVATAVASDKKKNGGALKFHSLRVMGCLVNNNSSSDAADEMSGIKTRRQEADVWIDLDTSGRSLINLFCCSYKYASQLHIIEHAGDHQHFRNGAHNTEVISCLGIENVNRLRNGQIPTEQVGLKTISKLEGSLLPSHCRPMFRKPESATEDVVSPKQPANSSLTGSPSKYSPSAGCGQDGAINDSSFNDNDSVVSNTSLILNTTNLVDVPPSIAAAAAAHFEDDTCPPRLNFPKNTDGTEFAVLLQKINAGFVLRRLLAGQSNPTPDDTTAPMVNGVVAFLLRFAMWFLQQVMLPVLEFGGRFLYTARLSEGRTREAINAISLLLGQSASCGLHPIFPHLWEGTSPLQRRICLLNFFMCNLVDIAAGILVSYTLQAHHEAVFALVSRWGSYGLYELHVGYVEWFLGWPGGFKMNEALNQLLGSVCLLVLNAWHSLSLIVSGYLAMSLVNAGYGCAQLFSVFGVSTFFGVIADATNISTLHVRNLAHVFGVLYRFFLTLLSSLSLQFRGKRHNPLRNRIDDGDFTVDQVLLGTLIGTMLLFIFPTLAVYYFYMTVVRTSVWIVQEGMQGLGLLSSKLPVGRFLTWVLYRHQLPSGITINVKGVEESAGVPASSPTNRSTKFPAGNGNTTVVMTLETKPLAFGSVLSEFLVVATSVASALRPQRLMNFIIHAKDKPKLDPRKSVFSHLVSSPTCPQVKLPLKPCELS